MTIVEDALVCARATSEQITQHFENNSQMWAAPLSRLQYLHLQNQLAKGDAHVGITQYWVLFNSCDPETIISSCSVYFRSAAVNSGRGMESVKAAIITDIFTHADFRREGMATKLLIMVQKVLNRMANDGVEEPQDAHQQRINFGSSIIPKPSEDKNMTRLAPNELSDLCLEEINIAKLRLSLLRSTDITFVQLLDTRGVLAWHLARSLALKRHLGSTMAKEHTCIYGVKYSGQRGVTAWAWWAPDFRSRKLFIGHIATSRFKGMQTPIAKILHEAVAEAYAFGLKEVVMWDPTNDVTEAGILLGNQLGEGVQVILEARPDNIPLLRTTGAIVLARVTSTHYSFIQYSFSSTIPFGPRPATTQTSHQTESINFRLVAPKSSTMSTMPATGGHSQSCCNVPPIVRKGYKPKGTYEEIGGFRTYVTGPSDATRALVVIFDIFGYFEQTLQGADILAHSDNEHKYKVLIPDWFKGKPADIEWYPPKTPEQKEKLGAFFGEFPPPVVAANVPAFVQAVKEKNASLAKFGIVGYCWGGKVATISTKADKSPFEAIAAVHPAMIDPADAQGIKVPMALLASGDEPAEDVKKFEETLTVPKHVEIFKDQIHGWMAARSDLSKDRVKEEYERGYKVLLSFFGKHL
ncbi:hypothetical protein ED733_005210 [Metarhizium rileyi]|uniref:Uncharacterized protein n=1 Tax=Metarhizium rileyi (strain RCEF 4871) TaxID=1649241 RepID=A0A5C6GBD3_METRR|nr:hypothetical protein ED733_005210 [Metarhizium rileyi]